jgi:hypothetical protein
MTTIPTGIFMQPALCASEPMAYVVGGEGLPKMIAESEYRAAGYEPPFETLRCLMGWNARRRQRPPFRRMRVMT